MTRNNIILLLIGIYNFLVFQWLGYRVCALFDDKENLLAYGLMGPVWPLTGWFGTKYKGYPKVRMTYWSK